MELGLGASTALAGSRCTARTHVRAAQYVPALSTQSQLHARSSHVLPGMRFVHRHQLHGQQQAAAGSRAASMPSRSTTGPMANGAAALQPSSPPPLAIALLTLLAPLITQLTQHRMQSLQRAVLLVTAQAVQLAGVSAAPAAWWCALCAAWVGKVGEEAAPSTVALLQVLAQAATACRVLGAGQPGTAGIQLLMGPKAHNYMVAMQDEVARGAGNLSPEQAVSFLRACVACGEPLPLPHVLAAAARAFCDPSTSTSSIGRAAAGLHVTDPGLLSQAMVLLVELGAHAEDVPPGFAEAAAARLHEAVIGGRTLPPLLLLEACQAACTLGSPVLYESLVVAAIRGAERHLSQHPATHASLALSTLYQAAACYRWAAPEPPSAEPTCYPMPPPTSLTPSPFNARSSSPASVATSMQQLAATVCACVAPQLQTMPTGQMAELLELLQRVGYRPVQQPQFKVSGAGPHPAPSGAGPMVNQYHITVLAPSGPNGSASITSTSSPGSDVNGGPETSMRLGQGVDLASAAASARGSLAQNIQVLITGQQVSQQMSFIPALHAALLQRLPHIPDTDTLMDVLRPMAALRLLPPREAMLSIVDQIPSLLSTSSTAASSSSSPSAAGITATSHASSHELVMYLFLWASTGTCPPAATIKAVQRQLAPCMQDLTPADLTSAVWAITVLTGMQASAAGSQPLSSSSIRAASTANRTPTATASPSTSTSASSTATAAGTGAAIIGPTTQQPGATTASSSSERISEAKSVLDAKIAAARAAAAERPLPEAWTRLNNTASNSRTLADIMSANTANAARSATATEGSQTQSASCNTPAITPAGGGNDSTPAQSPVPRFVQEAWFKAALAAIQVAVERNVLVPHQIAFILGSLHKLSEAAELTNTGSTGGSSNSMAGTIMAGAPAHSSGSSTPHAHGSSSSSGGAGATPLPPRPIPAALIDAMLTSFTQQLPLALPGDVALLLASCARLAHVPSYAVMDELVEGASRGSVADLMTSFSPRELATVAWSLARMHHRPEPEVTTALLCAAEACLEHATVDSLAALAWAVAEQPPAEDADARHFMAALCEATRSRLSEFAPRDLVSLLSALGRVKFQPDTAWLSDALSATSVHLPYIDAPGYVAVLDALLALEARVPNPRWWGAFCRTMQPLLGRMSPGDLATAANKLLAVGHKPDADWQDRWMQAVDGLCAGGPLAAASAEELLAAAVALGVSEVSPLQMASLERSLAGLSALSDLPASKLVRLVCSVSALGERGAAHLPSAGWVGGPLTEAVRAALPNMQLKECADLARVLGPLAARPEYAPATAPALHDLRAYLREYFLYSN